MAFSMRPCLAALFTIFIASFSSISLATNLLPASTISAAPAILPDFGSPLSSPPALSPDIYPDFPSPGGDGLSPSESSMPLIPSSPSPPNPDAMEAPGPLVAFGPSGLMPDSVSSKVNVQVVVLSLVVVVVCVGLVNVPL